MQTVTDREIKFRAWDGEKMLPPQNLTQNSKYWGWLGKKDVELMQYTGSQDRNGQDIYEGDIVRHHYWNGNYKNSVVEFKKTEASDDMGLDMIGFQDFEGCEVIGNIFENSELLEVEK